LFKKILDLTAKGTGVPTIISAGARDIKMMKNVNKKGT